MQLNDIRSAPGARKSSKRVGRGAGSGMGKTATRGNKGQKSRSGGSIARGFEGGQMPLQMRLPKFGFSSRMSKVTAEIRCSELAKVDGEVVNLESLRSAGLINSNIRRARIIASGEVSQAYQISGIHVTSGAKKIIEKAGGSIA